jgi:hypothetical protein
MVLRLETAFYLFVAAGDINAAFDNALVDMCRIHLISPPGDIKQHIGEKINNKMR